MGYSSAAPYSAGVPPSLNRNGPLIFSMWMRPSCTASTALAISSSLRAATAGSASGLGDVLHAETVADAKSTESACTAFAASACRSSRSRSPLSDRIPIIMIDRDKQEARTLSDDQRFGAFLGGFSGISRNPDLLLASAVEKDGRHPQPDGRNRENEGEERYGVGGR